jgi:hypothetical protein
MFCGSGAAWAADPPPTPAPACRIAFLLPLADGTTASAVCLPGANGQTLLVYVAGGKLATGAILLDGVTPLPPIITPPPIVVPPVIPPIDPVGKVRALIVVTDQPIANPAWKASEVTSFLSKAGLPPPYEYNLALVADPNADPTALKWIGKSAIGNASYPFFFVVTDKGEILEQGPLTLKAAELAALMSKHLAKGDAKR